MIGHVADKLKAVSEIQPPDWMGFAKTGPHKQRAPQLDAFWYTRCASLLRKVYVNGPVGVSELRRQYGGRKNRGVRPDKKVRAGGSIIRKSLQQLEKAGFIETKKTGRLITAKGKSFMDKAAKEIA